MKVVGYWRSRVDDLDGSQQKCALKKAGCEFIFGIEGVNSFSSVTSRPFRACLDALDFGDLFICQDLSLLGELTEEILVSTDELLQKGVFIKTLDQRLDTSLIADETICLVVRFMSYVAYCQSLNIKQKISAGRANAKSRGVSFGRKKTYSEHQVKEVIVKRNEGMSYGMIANDLRMSRSMVQRIVQNNL